jgi:hypothetical protein
VYQHRKLMWSASWCQTIVNICIKYYITLHYKYPRNLSSEFLSSCLVQCAVCFIYYSKNNRLLCYYRNNLSNRAKKIFFHLSTYATLLDLSYFLLYETWKKFAQILNFSKVLYAHILTRKYLFILMYISRS